MDYKNKRILFLGDSITALNTTERGWVKYFNEIMEPSFFLNISVSGARLSNGEPVEYDGNPVFLGEKTDYNQNVLSNQIEKILRATDKNNKNYSYNSDYEEFDIIMVAAGTNDWFYEKKCNIDTIENEFTAEGKAVLSENINCYNWAGAMRYIYETLNRIYPSARIYFCSPVQGAEDTRPYKEILYKRNLMSAICDRISDVTFVDTFNCGICGVYEKSGENGRDLIDGLHPNINGAKKIGIYNARAVKQSLL